MNAPRQADGPAICEGLPYSAIAHLAEDVTAFVGVAQALARLGVRVPQIFEADIDNGLLLIEDLGTRVFGNEIAAGASIEELYRPAVELLAGLAGAAAPDAVAIEAVGSNPDAAAGAQARGRRL